MQVVTMGCVLMMCVSVRKDGADNAVTKVLYHVCTCSVCMHRACYCGKHAYIQLVCKVRFNCATVYTY